MQTFIDTAAQTQWAFDDDVVVTRDESGVYVFTAADGAKLDVPSTLKPHVVAQPSEDQVLTEAKALRAALVSAACGAFIMRGFRSSALGAAHDYPSLDVDQRNLQSAVSASIGAAERWKTLIWCSDGAAWALAEHTAAEVQAVNADWVDFRVAAQRRYADMVANINAATTISAVQAISWD